MKITNCSFYSTIPNSHFLLILLTVLVIFILQKGYFIGKFALQRQKEQGVEKRLTMFVLEDIDPDKDIWPWGYEPIYRNDQFVGTVTSAGYVSHLFFIKLHN